MFLGGWGGKLKRNQFNFGIFSPTDFFKKMEGWVAGGRRGD